MTESPTYPLRRYPGLTVGVLALQGAVSEHIAAIERLGARGVAVKTAGQLATIDGLIIPGGESTTVMRLLDRFELGKPLRLRVRGGMPAWGSCMGMIVLARDVAEMAQPTLDLLDITVRRNAFGRQAASAEVPLTISELGPQPFPAIFIRAPWVERVGAAVTILADRDGHGVLVRQQHVLGSSFHPELSGDDRLHAYFLEMIVERAL